MKKIVAILSLSFLIVFSVQAQNNGEELQIEMEKALEQMQEMMKGFGTWMEEAPLFMDTTIIREFHFPTDEFNGMLEQFPTEEWTNMMFHFSPDSLMNMELFKGMEDMVRQWSDPNMLDMEEWFKDLEQLMPTLPEFEGPQRPNQPKEKKRKTTRI